MVLSILTPARREFDTQLAAILQAGCALVQLERKLPPELQTLVGKLAHGPEQSERFELDCRQDRSAMSALVVAALDALGADRADLGQRAALVHDVMMQVDAAFALRDALDGAGSGGAGSRLGVRIERITSDGCRLFHVDRVQLRMLCTWHGGGSEWLPEGVFDRSKLGCGCNDHVRDFSAVRRLPTASIAVMKGDVFPGEYGRGLVHRAPPASPQAPRLLLVIDVA